MTDRERRFLDGLRADVTSAAAASRACAACGQDHEPTEAVRERIFDKLGGVEYSRKVLMAQRGLIEGEILEDAMMVFLSLVHDRLVERLSTHKKKEGR